MSGSRASDDFVPVADRLRWMQLCRVVMCAALPLLAAGTGSPAAVVQRQATVSIAWVVLSLGFWGLSAIGRRSSILVLNVALLGDGLVLGHSWFELHELSGPVGMVIMVHTIAVTLVATFRTGIKIVLWHSLLAMLILDMHATGILSPVFAFPVRETVTYLSGLWAAALATAFLAAANERELRRRRYDERVLRELALELGAQQRPAEVAATLALFVVAELDVRRAAVVVLPDDRFTAQLGAGGIAATVGADGRLRKAKLSGALPPPALEADRSLFRHVLDPVADAWLLSVMPRGRNLITIPFGEGQTAGVLIVETVRRWPDRYSRRVERRLIATARQAAAQSAAAVGRSLATMKLAEAANTDGLTGLTNRARFDVLLAERAAGTQPFSVILLDLDHFKSVNDTYGHQTGDGVLQGVAAALRFSCRAGDVVARYGGEELVVLADGDAAETKETAERLRAAVAAAATPVPVTASIGAACGPADGRTPESLLETADRRLYVAKRTGRDRSVTAADDNPAEAERTPAGPGRIG